MSITGLPWQVAHELFLCYLEEVERLPGDETNLSNVFEKGSQDTMITRAKAKAKQVHGAGIFREQPGANDQGDGQGKQWNKRFATDPKCPACISYNLGVRHPANALTANGTCKYRHVCDHWVSDKGPGGICGSKAHTRANCDNPNKCDQPCLLYTSPSPRDS